MHFFFADFNERFSHLMLKNLLKVQISTIYQTQLIFITSLKFISNQTYQNISTKFQLLCEKNFRLNQSFPIVYKRLQTLITFST